MKRKTTVFHFDAGGKDLAHVVTGPSRVMVGFPAALRYSDVPFVEVHVPLFDEDEDIRSSDELPDLIGCGFDVAISHRVFQLLKSSTVDETVRFVDAKVVNQKGDVLSDEYVLPYSESWHNVLDLKRTKGNVYSNGMIDEVGLWKIDGRLLPDADFWLAHAERWVVSAALATELQAAGLSGLSLTKQRVY